MIWHAPWGGRSAIEGQRALDAFAGTGALGLEALSRGAAETVFMEQDPDALTALRANIASCKAGPRARVLAADVLQPPLGQPCRLVFLDPPYGQGLVPRAIAALARGNWIAAGALVIAEVGAEETLELPGPGLGERRHGAGRVLIHRYDPRTEVEGSNPPASG